MRQLLRPFFIIVLASFLIGVWYSLSEEENPKPPTAPTSDDPLIILARYPQLWQDFLHPLIEGKRLPIEIRSSGLNQYSESLRACDLVETRSDFIPALIQQKLIQPLPKEYASIVAMVHPDFFPPELDQEENYFFPLFWATYAWLSHPDGLESSWEAHWQAHIRQQGGVKLYGDYETLLSALLKHDVWPETEIEGEDTEGATEADDEMLKLNKWIDSWISHVEWKFGASPVSSLPSDEGGLQSLSHVYYGQAPSAQLFSSQELVVWGLSPCLKSSGHPALKDLLNYLAHGEGHLPILKKYGLASALNSSVHWKETERLHSARALRDLQFSKISWRNVSWDHLVMWDQILRTRISPATEQ